MAAIEHPRENVSLHLEKVNLDHVNEVQAIIDGAPTFSINVEGLTHDSEYARRDLTALPPGCSAEQKHFFIIRNGKIGIGVADLVQDYPIKGTAFLGLLLIAEAHQGNGLGREAYRLVEVFATTTLAAQKMRLAYNDSNPVATFWEKMGFKATGESKPYTGKARNSNVLLMERSLEAGEMKP